MKNERRLIRLDVGDFLEIRPLKEVGRCYEGRCKNLSLMGICFSSDVEWKKGQVLYIDYFISEKLDSVRLKMLVVWSEFIDSKDGYFCGGQIIDIDEGKQEEFASYYFERLRKEFF